MALKHSTKALLGGSAAVAFGLLVWNVGNFLFFVLAARLIRPEKFGVVAAVLALTVACIVPCGGVQAAVARRIAANHAHREMFTGFLQHGRRVVPVGAAIGALLAVAALRPVGADVSRAILLTAVAVSPLPFLFGWMGLLQGMGRFESTATPLVALGVSRPIVLVAVAPFCSNVTAALVANAASCVFAWLVADALGSRNVGTPLRSKPSLRTVATAVATPMAGLSAVAILANADVVAASVKLSGLESGHYGAITALSKGAVLLLPTAIAFVLLPRVASRHAAGHRTGSLLALSVLLALGLGLVVAGLFALVHGPLVGIFGVDYRSASWLLAPSALAATPLAAVFMLMNHHIARGDGRFAWSCLGLSIAVIAAYVVVGDSATALLWVASCAAVLALVAHEFIHGRTDQGLVASARALVVRSGGR